MASRHAEVRRVPGPGDDQGRSPIIDYESSDYAERFWSGREYEDAVERIALGKLLPPAGEVLADVGAGHGRLADLYSGFRTVILIDPARSVLEKAVAAWGDDPRFVFARANLSRLPMDHATCDTIVTVRVLHHIPDLRAAFAEVHRVLRPGGAYVLEYANKRNLKEILRAAVGRSRRRPFAHAPAEALPLHFTFHPAYVDGALRETRFRVERALAVSTFRIPFLKRWIPTTLLAKADGWLQEVGAPLKFTPSVFLRALADKPNPDVDPAGLFACPQDGTPLSEAGSGLACPTCGRSWEPQGGIYDFAPSE
ncbi:MAG: class I SAM-dependent methyltransferase [Anaerolineae bacterium]